MPAIESVNVPVTTTITQASTKPERNHAYFNVDDYKEFLLKMQGGKMYLQVIGQIKAAIDYGVMLGVEQEVIDDPDVVRVKATVKLLNKHLDNWESLPEHLQVGTYVGWADNLKVGGKGAARDFPLEDALTSAVGRALTLAGFNYQTTATADEMQTVEKKKAAGSGYKDTDTVVTELSNALKKTGVKTKADADAAAQQRYGKPWNNLTPAEMRQWLAAVATTPEVPF